MEVKDLLPIGSIVLLKDGEKRLMIIGVMQNDTGGTRKDYDYLGVLYPEGHIGEKFQFLFNQEDINEIVFRGYEDEERTKFLAKLAAHYERQSLGSGSQNTSEKGAASKTLFRITNLFKKKI